MELRVKQVQASICYAPMVREAGIEPAIFRLSTEGFSQLSYSRTYLAGTAGVEPANARVTTACCAVEPHPNISLRTGHRDRIRTCIIRRRENRFRKPARFPVAHHGVLAGTERFERSSSGSEPEILAAELRAIANKNLGDRSGLEPERCAFRRRAGNPCADRSWSTRLASNQRPRASETRALSI